jgi:molybdopterin molybdotransferase
MNPLPPMIDVRGRGFSSRADVDAVLQLLAARTMPLSPEAIPLAQAAGRVLARAIVSPVNVPGFIRAAMDGFAVRAADTRGASAANPCLLNLVGESWPARPFVGQLAARQAIRIATGSPVPAGADAILVTEAALLTGESGVLAREEVVPGRHVARVGEDVEQGRPVLPAGRWLRPQDVGLLASIGVGTVPVIRRPQVSLLITGNELLPPGSIPEGYRIVDSNSPMLTALVARDGGLCSPPRALPDQAESLRAAIRQASTTADVILVSGGSSVGAEDYSPRVVAELGELAIHGIAMRPAGPTGVAFLPRRTVDLQPSQPAPAGLESMHVAALPLFLLPGNPVSCLCAYDLFAGRVVRRLGGRPWGLPYRRVSVPLGASIASVVGRLDYVRVKLENGQVIPLPSGGASNLSSTVIADGFLLLDRDRDQLDAGETVEVWLYSDEEPTPQNVA